MKIMLSLIGFLSLFLEIGTVTYNPMENPDLFQGDIAGIEDFEERSGIPDNTKRWPGGEIPYIIDSSLEFHKDLILAAMQHIEERTCIKFIPWDMERRDYIRLFAGFGCYSYWGRIGRIQPLSLGEGCEYFGTIVHELNHAIGFDHEQNRSDRDDYLIIYWQNIMEDSLDQFEKYKPQENRLINDFDYDSIMLYGEKTFSKDGWSKTMKAKKKGIPLLEVNQKGKLSDSDVYRINSLYEC